MNRRYVTFKIVLAVLFMVTVLVLAMPRTTSFSYDYRKGSAWKYETLYAQFDFPLLKTGEQMEAERASMSGRFVPYYRFSSEIVNRSLKSAEGLELGRLKQDVVMSMTELFSTGILPDAGVMSSDKAAPSDVLFIQRDKRAVRRPVTEVFMLTDARAKLYADISSRVDSLNVDSLFSAVGVYDLLVPNLIYDRQTTELVNADMAGVVSPTAGYINAGQLIVSEGEIVTAEVEQMLDSYRKEYEANVGYDGPRFLLWTGNTLVALVVVLLMLGMAVLSKATDFNDRNLWYLVTVFMLTALMALLIIRVDESLLYMMPFTLPAIYLRSFFKARRVLPVYAAALLPLLIFAHQGVVLYVMFLCAGAVSMYALPYLGKGWKQFLLSLIVFVTLVIVFMGFYLIHPVDGSMVSIVARLFVASFLAVAGFPLVYLFERMFSFVSDTRLAELCDTANPLLRQLEQKAPGTFQHSLQVMNMADFAARSVDANPLLLRAGALYHDIGKLANPQCFVENESLLPKAEKDKYHYALSPRQSAHDIIRHVDEGVELARRYHLPDVIGDFIRTHHGTTLTGYFWGNYIKGKDADLSLEPEFRYPGGRPETKEQVILMLCDSIEAASRTLTEFTPDAYSAFVERIVKGKMDDGQLDFAHISVSELGTVKEAIKSYLAQVHHERIVYPDSKIKSIFRHESRKQKN